MFGSCCISPRCLTRSFHELYLSQCSLIDHCIDSELPRSLDCSIARSFARSIAHSFDRSIARSLPRSIARSLDISPSLACIYNELQTNTDNIVHDYFKTCDASYTSCSRSRARVQWIMQPKISKHASLCISLIPYVSCLLILHPAECTIDFELGACTLSSLKPII